MPYTVRPYVPSRDPMSAIPPSRHPFQVWVMFALLLSGLSNFLAAGSEVVSLSVDPFFHKVWAVTLFGASLLTLLGAYWRDRVMGLLMERAGLFTMGISCPTYGVMFIYQAGIGQGVGGFLTITIGIAAFWRVVHVYRELRILRGFMREAGLHE